MGTRCGDIDPGILLYLLQELDHKSLEKVLNKESGLLGLCGSNDMREITNNGSVDAKRALKMFVYRIQKYIGSKRHKFYHK